MKVFIIIVTFNGANWIEQCLNSILKKYKIIVVDNNSTDDTIFLIENFFPEVEVIKVSRNLGFGAANNIGIKNAFKKEADYVFLLNQDTYIKGSAIDKLVSVSLKNKRFGILSPVHLNWEGNLIEYYFERFISKNRKFYSDNVLNLPLDEVYEVPFVNAAAWLIPRIVLEKIGGFDPIFFHYGEDNNYCQRVIYHDFKIGVVPDAFICHDSIIRLVSKNAIFNEQYYKNEINKLIVKYSDINLNISHNDFRSIKLKIFKLIIINIFKLNLKYIKGYIIKYWRYNPYYDRIIKSRKQNMVKNSNYL